MGKDKDKQRRPTAEDAQVVLKLYDLRREAVMRESRDAIVRWLPTSYEEFVAITKPDSDLNRAFRQVSSYFEMAYGFARHGAVHPELLAEGCGEGLLLYTKVLPFLDRFRAEVSPTAFSNAEWVAENTAFAKDRIKLFEKRLEGMRAAKA